MDLVGVQLWEGGPYWAECNVGAITPEEYGYYFWWGDTVGYKRENDAWVASDGSSTPKYALALSERNMISFSGALPWPFCCSSCVLSC